MGTKIHDFWPNILLASNIESHCIYNLTELHKLPKKPGIYAWYLISEATNFGEYHKIYKQKKINVTIEGNLKENYKGEIKAIYEDKDFHSPSLDHDLCKIASLAFSPPLYIGISKDLQTRLKTHTSELEKIVNGSLPLPSPQALGKTDFDTILESSHFAQRIGHSINSFSSLTMNSLLIRTIEMPAGYTWQDLQKVEKYINRTYTPIYGRK